MLPSESTSSSSNKVNKVTFGYQIHFFYSPIYTKTLDSSPLIPSQPAKAEPFVELYVDLRKVLNNPRTLAFSAEQLHIGNSLEMTTCRNYFWFAFLFFEIAAAF
jgi:hypothetical protein